MHLLRLLFSAVFHLQCLTAHPFTGATSAQLNGSTISFISHHCSAPFFGQPNPDDCTALLSAVFPSPSDPRARIFDFEELRADTETGNWRGARKLPLTDIVQLPKQYTKRTCNVGIFPYHEPGAARGYGSVVGSWEAIHVGGQKLVKDCVTNEETGKGGGEFYVFSATQRLPVLTIFIWATGAVDFESRLNAFESNPTTVLQIDGHWHWGSTPSSPPNDTSVNVNAASLSQNATSIQGTLPSAIAQGNFSMDALGLDAINWTSVESNQTMVSGSATGNATTSSVAEGKSSQAVPLNMPGGGEGSGVVSTY